MQVYKRGAVSMVKGLVLAVAAAAAVYIFAGIFVGSTAVALLVAAAVLVLLGHSAIFSENIRLELEGEELRYYQRQQLRGRYHLPDCAVRCRIRTESGFPATHDIDLYIADRGSGSGGEVHIDCSPLSRGQFDDLFARIEQITAPGVHRIAVKTRDK